MDVLNFLLSTHDADSSFVFGSLKNFLNLVKKTNKLYGYKKSIHVKSRIVKEGCNKINLIIK